MLALAIGLFLAALLGKPAFHVFDTYWPKRPHNFDFVHYDPRDPVVIERSEKILDELEGANGLPEWAGTYSFGDGYESQSLELAPNSGFEFTATGCLGLYAQASGQVQVRGTRIHLEADFQENKYENEYPLDEFLFVKWGSRKYLIAPDQRIAFANDVRSSLESRWWPGGKFFASCEVDGPVPEELPEVPPEFVEAFSAARIRAKVLSILSADGQNTSTDGSFYIRVQLDLGRDRGAYAQLSLVPADPYVGFILGTVVEVEDECSVAEIYVSSTAVHPEVDWIFVPEP